MSFWARLTYSAAVAFTNASLPTRLPVAFTTGAGLPCVSFRRVKVMPHWGASRIDWTAVATWPQSTVPVGPQS